MVVLNFCVVPLRRSHIGYRDFLANLGVLSVEHTVQIFYDVCNHVDSRFLRL